VTYYLAHSGEEDDFFGVPFPAVGVRVVFDIERLFAARERLMKSSVERNVVGDEGIVVHEHPMAMLTLPDRLWSVDDVEGEIRDFPSNQWFRCKSLTVREELPPWLAMGPHGDSVKQVIDQALDLTDEQASTIAATDAADEKRLVQIIWDRWLSSRKSGSPVGFGLAAIHDAVVEAARRTGPHLFRWDEEDGVEVIGDPRWEQAGSAANAAALAFGEPDILSTEENSGWRCDGRVGVAQRALEPERAAMNSVVIAPPNG
jgi:hypothetical protein